MNIHGAVPAPDLSDGFGGGARDMPLTDAEFSAILGDESKRIRDDIEWSGDRGRASARQFRAAIVSEAGAGRPLFVKGRYNPAARTLSYAIILPEVGRICGLDLGKAHKNPRGDRVGETHKHQWTERYRDRVAHVPGGVTAPVSEPVEVWGQFCKEAGLRHDGVMRRPVSPEDPSP